MSLHVLIVDDHEPMRVLLTRVLQRMGAVVREAANGEAALAAIAEAPAHLVISDYSMPGMSGAALAGALRAQAGAGLRILMLTGHKSAAIAEEARSAGADAVLVKPVTPSALLATIAQLMAQTAEMAR